MLTRCLTAATINGIGNLASIYGAYIWPSSTAPQYVPGNAGEPLFSLSRHFGTMNASRRCAFLNSIKRLPLSYLVWWRRPW